MRDIKGRIEDSGFPGVGWESISAASQGFLLIEKSLHLIGKKTDAKCEVWCQATRESGNFLEPNCFLMESLAVFAVHMDICCIMCVYNWRSNLGRVS